MLNAATLALSTRVTNHNVRDRHGHAHGRACWTETLFFTPAFPAGLCNEVLHALPFAPMITKKLQGLFPWVVVLGILEPLAVCTSIWMVVDPMAHAPCTFVGITLAKPPDTEVNVHPRVIAEIWCRRVRARMKSNDSVALIQQNWCKVWPMPAFNMHSSRWVHGLALHGLWQSIEVDASSAALLKARKARTFRPN